MRGFIFQELELKGSFLIEDFYAGDNRGEFVKLFEKDIFKNKGIEFSLNETFLSVSAKNVIRGLHFQSANPQSKLVSVVSGSIWDVIVDLRLDSPTFKKWVGEELSARNHKSIFVPRGFAHGFASLKDGTAVLYQCDGKYDTDTDTGICFDDPEIAVDWPVDSRLAVCSQRDMNLMSFKEYMVKPMELSSLK